MTKYLHFLKTKVLLVFICCLFFIPTQAQDIIYIQNPSFENKTPQFACPPKGWFDCGSEEASAVDVHGENTNIFGVNKTPSDGNNFLGMVTRSDQTWECVGQKLSTPLSKQKTYQLEIDISKSSKFLSHITKPKPKPKKTSRKNVLFSRANVDFIETHFIDDTVLRIQASNSKTGANEILATSKIIDHEDWKTHRFVFQPTADYDVIILEAFYPNPNELTNGNILLDNCSNIVEILEPSN